MLLINSLVGDIIVSLNMKLLFRIVPLHISPYIQCTVYTSEWREAQAAAAAAAVAFDFCPDTDELFKINEDIQTVGKQVI